MGNINNNPSLQRERKLPELKMVQKHSVTPEMMAHCMSPVASNESNESIRPPVSYRYGNTLRDCDYNYRQFKRDNNLKPRLSIGKSESLYSMEDRTEYSDMSRNTPQKSVISCALRRPDLKPLINPITILYRFWRDVIDQLQSSVKKELSTLVATHFYTNNCEYRVLFEKTSPQQFGLHFLDMARWLLLTASHRGGDMLLTRIQRLECVYSDGGVPFSQWYSAMLTSMHICFVDTFGKDIYTLKVQLSMDQLFKVIIAASNDKHESVEPMPTRYRQPKPIKSFLVSLDACLRSKRGLAYLENYCAAKHASEYIHFHKEYINYKAAKTNLERMAFGEVIMATFFGDESSEEVFFSVPTKRSLSNVSRANRAGYTNDLFDSAHKEVLSFIDAHIWANFVQSMAKII